jgi:hypothetical protein
MMTRFAIYTHVHYVHQPKATRRKLSLNVTTHEVFSGPPRSSFSAESAPSSGSATAAEAATAAAAPRAAGGGRRLRQARSERRALQVASPECREICSKSLALV